MDPSRKFCAVPHLLGSGWGSWCWSCVCPTLGFPCIWRLGQNGDLGVSPPAMMMPRLQVCPGGPSPVHHLPVGSDLWVSGPWQAVRAEGSNPAQP